MRILLRSQILRDQIELCYGNVEHVALRVFNTDIVLGDTVDVHLLNSAEYTDSVRAVDYVIALDELGKAVNLLTVLFLASQSALGKAARLSKSLTYEYEPFGCKLKA